MTKPQNTQVQSVLNMQKYYIYYTVGLLMFSVNIRPFRVNSSLIKTNCKEIHHIRNNNIIIFCPVNKNLLRTYSAWFLTRHPIYKNHFSLTWKNRGSFMRVFTVFQWEVLFLLRIKNGLGWVNDVIYSIHP